MRKGFSIAFLGAIVVLSNVLIFRYEQLRKSEHANLDLSVRNSVVAHFAPTSRDRIANAVVTLPDGDTLVSLRDGAGTYAWNSTSKKKRDGECDARSDTWYKIGRGHARRQESTTRCVCADDGIA